MGLAVDRLRRLADDPDDGIMVNIGRASARQIVAYIDALEPDSKIDTMEKQLRWLMANHWHMNPPREIRWMTLDDGREPGRE